MADRRKKKSTPATQRRSQGRSKPAAGAKKKSNSWLVLFWLGFAILLVGIFLVNREAISSSIQIIQNEISARRNPPGNKPDSPLPELSQQPSQPNTTVTKPDLKPVPSTAQPAPREAAPARGTQQETSGKPAAQSAPQASSPAVPPQNTKPQAAQGQTGQSSGASQIPQTVQNPAELRDRALYFIHVDRGGSILREKVNRKLPVSDSPMSDAIQAVVAGPNGDEKQKGLISLIPPKTRLLSATVRGDTAYISFSEDFQYNTYGVEGYAGQLKQVIFTATEFPNVQNVQILIEGRKVDYLGEGIWIGSPLDRDML